MFAAFYKKYHLLVARDIMFIMLVLSAAIFSNTSNAVTYDPGPGYPAISCSNASVNTRGPGDIWRCIVTPTGGLHIFLSTFHRNGSGPCGLEWGTPAPGWQSAGAYFNHPCGANLALYVLQLPCSFGGTYTSEGLCAGAPSCPPGQQLDGQGICQVPNTLKNVGTCDTCVANPINPAIGNKFQREVDYTGQGAFPLQFSRFYNSDPRQLSTSFAPATLNNRIGLLWRGHYDRFIKLNGTTGTVYRQDGKAFTFNLVGGLWTPPADISDQLQQLTDGGGNPAGWKYTTATGDMVETYDTSGKLISVANREGLTHTLAYDAQSRLSTVTDTFGRTLTFTYDGSNRVATMTDPQGGVYQYGYDIKNNLISVAHPDTTVRRYHYEHALPNALTGITDENSARFSTWNYTISGYATSSTHPGGANQTTVSYGNGATVTDALGAVRTYNFGFALDVAKNTGVAQPAGSGTGTASDRRTYDANGNVASRTDFNGNRTSYTYDLARNLETSRTEGLTSSGASTAATRTVTTEWHPSYRLPTRIAEPFRITAMVYGNPTDPVGTRGSLLSKTMQATTDATGAAGLGAPLSGTPRTWTYTYNANGSVLTLDGPRTDVPDVTNYTYYANDAACSGASPLGCRGQVASITNAAGHVTSIPDYNAHGQPLAIVDPNGLTTTLTYDARQRLTSRSVGGEMTSYTYDGVGQLTRVTLPDGSLLAYTYDAAHRLTGISDNLGNRIAYTLDAMGNRTQEQVLDPASQLAQTRSRVYNSLNRLTQEIGAQSQTTAYSYDNQGNVTAIDGPLAGTVDVTTNAYDALNRLTRVTDPNAGQVNYGYNGLDQLTSVTDPRSLVTSYSYDGLNNLNQQQSPDTGATTNTYNAAGNLLTQTDAKGQTTAYTYDALNRVTSITYQGGVTHGYQYDQGANGLGRLTQITEPNSTTQYAYDPKGRLITETRTINAVVYVTNYSYDSAGRLTGMTYPSGRQVAYTLDSLGRVSQITTTKGTATQTVVSSVAYRPFGPSQGFTFGNGQTYTRGFDQDGRIASYTLGNQSLAVGYDAASRVGFLSDVGTPANSTTYAYDNLDRLVQAITPATPYAYAYDAVGNRVSKTVGSATQTYDYAATSNRLTQVTGVGSRSYGYDPNGSTVNDGDNQFAYDSRGRLIQSVGALGASNYQVNSLGQRIRKTNVQGDTVYHYDVQGRLIAESSTGGTAQKEYLYLGDMPVAVIQ